MKDFKCRICDNATNNSRLVIYEKMFASNQPFDYIKCGRCGCFQLVDENIDMQLYYPEHYFAYNESYNAGFIKDVVGKCYLKYRLGKFTVLGCLVYPFLKKNQPWINKQYVSFNSRILDIGCGAGRLLKLLHHRGFKFLTGLEPYNKNEIIYKEKVVIHNSTLFEHNEKYDFIMMHYSFEHMPEPRRILKKLFDLLDDNGTLLVRIPIVDSYAFRKYKENWIQMDAPRHIYLYSVNGFMQLCKQFNFRVDKLEYESSEYQFIESEKYRHGLEFKEELKVTKKEKKIFKKSARKLNLLQDGDQVRFYLKKDKL